MPARKIGLRVKHSDHVAQKTGKRGMATRYAPVEEAWFVWVKICGRWNALTDLRFLREQDAIRAAHSLTAAGLDTDEKLKRAGRNMVKQVACEFLQW